MSGCNPDDDHADAINEALFDAICSGDGRPRAHHLRAELAKRGLIIVGEDVERPAPLPSLVESLVETVGRWRREASKAGRRGFGERGAGEEFAMNECADDIAALLPGREIDLAALAEG